MGPLDAPVGWGVNEFKILIRFFGGTIEAIQKNAAFVWANKYFFFHQSRHLFFHSRGIFLRMLNFNFQK